MSIFDRIFRRGGDVSAARKAELRGDLSRAQMLWAEADRPDEAARVMLLRGDGEGDAQKRLPLYTQAAAIAPLGHDIRHLARKKRAELVVAMAAEGALSAIARHDVLDAAKELEAIGELASAAKAYALGRDAEGEARALAASGDLDQLEDVLAVSQTKDRATRRRREAHAEIDQLVTSGRRREALTLAETFALEEPDDAIARERSTSLRARRAIGPKIAIELHGARLDLLVGDEVIVGRTEGSLVIGSHAVSRRHLRVARVDGVAMVLDLGSRNGTTFRGAKLAGSLPIGDGLDLKLGNEVPLRIAPFVPPPGIDVKGAYAIDAIGVRHVAPLGPLCIGPWQIEIDDAGWLAIVSTEHAPAYVAGVMLVPRATLLAGDAIASSRSADPILRIVRGER